MKKIIIMSAALMAVIILSGCVNRQLAESYGEYLDTAGAEYVQYVTNDPDLSDDDKAIRINNHDQASQTAKVFKASKWSW